MGAKKQRTKFFLVMVFTLVTPMFDSCLLKKHISISNCYVDGTCIKVNLDCKNWTQEIKGFEMRNENDYYSIESDKISNKMIGKDKLVLTIDCTGQSIKTNREYEMILGFGGGRLESNIFFGNTIVKIGKEFPCENYQHIRILVFDQKTTIGI